MSGNPAFHVRFDEMPVFTGMHVIGGVVVLLLGGFQFVESLRRGHPLLHRWIAWVPNLIFVDWFLLGRESNRLAVRI